MSTLIERTQEMPRAVRWLLIAVFFTVLFLLWEQMIAPQAQAWNRKADKIESDLAAVKGASSLIDQWQSNKQALVAIGELDVPASEQQTRTSLTEAISEIVDEHRGNDMSWELGSARRLPNSAAFIKLNNSMVRLTGQVGQLEMMQGKLEFQAKPDVVMKIIADLEARPEVESISQIRMTVDDSVMDVTMTIDAWVYTRETNS